MIKSERWSHVCPIYDVISEVPLDQSGLYFRLTSLIKSIVIIFDGSFIFVVSLC